MLISYIAHEAKKLISDSVFANLIRAFGISLFGIFVDLIKERNLRVSLIAGSTSQAGQDAFALNFSSIRTKGRFLELGAGHPLLHSNTYHLERDFCWSGVSVDSSREFEMIWKHARNCNLIINPVEKIDWLNFFKTYGRTWNYLQIDINSGIQAYELMKNLVFSGGIFETITFEHDSYVSGQAKEFADRTIEFLSAHEYKLVAKNVKHRGRSFEDWWVHKDVQSNNRFQLRDGIEGKRNFSIKSRILDLLLSGHRAL